MQIAAVVKCSLIDYPGKIAAVVFTPGCNLNCFYCHNRALIDADSVTCGTTQKEVLAWLEPRVGLLDAVVISGGEPTIQTDIEAFIAEVRALDYLVKLDTNGTLPNVLASLINAGLLDYVAMDLKAPPEKYDAICGASVDQGAIGESIALLMDGRVEYEFRTTIIPQLTREDILAIGNRIRGARAYVLQRYCQLREEGPEKQSPWPFAREAPSWLEDVRYCLNRTVKTCLIRGFKMSSA